MPALPARGLVDERLHRQLIAHVGRKDQHARSGSRDAGELGFGFLEMILVDAADRDVHTLLQKRRRNRAPDAARAARDDRRPCLRVECAIRRTIYSPKAVPPAWHRALALIRKYPGRAFT